MAHMVIVHHNTMTYRVILVVLVGLKDAFEASLCRAAWLVLIRCQQRQLLQDLTRGTQQQPALPSLRAETQAQKVLYMYIYVNVYIYIYIYICMSSVDTNDKTL